MTDVAAHDQKVTHAYTIHYPAHEPRDNDPHKPEFDEYKCRRREDNTYHCDFAAQFRDGDTSECDTVHPLEAHHTHLEFAMQNGVDEKLLEEQYPGVLQKGVGAWLDGDQNLTLLCVHHHRGHQGVHVLAAADFEASKIIRGLTS